MRRVEPPVGDGEVDGDGERDGDVGEMDTSNIGEDERT